MKNHNVWTGSGLRFLRDRGNDKRGVALLLVIGLISILMISAVAFSISMRVERQGSYNYRHSIQARHLLWAALSDAISTINTNMDPKGTGANYSVYPDWDMIWSQAVGVYTQRARVLSFSGTNYLPSSLWALATDANKKAIFHNVTGTNYDKPSDTFNIVGRVGYIIANQSGLIDANVAGGLSRGRGCDPGELQLGELPEMSNTNAFYAQRKAISPSGMYASFGELTSTNMSAGLSSDIRNLALYSLSPNDLNPEGETKVWIGGDDAYLKTKIKDIKKAFVDCGVVDTDLAYLNLLDYVDSDSIPQDVGKGCSDTFPMINEVVVTCFVTANSNKQYWVTNAVQVEWCYPFDTPSKSDFTIDWSVTFSNNGCSDPLLVPPAMSGSDDLPLLANKYIHYYDFVADIKTLSGTLPVANPIIIKFIAEAKAQIKTKAGTLVDSVPYTSGGYNGTNIQVPVTIIFPCPTSTQQPVSIVSTGWCECIDPRFNWDPSNASGWQWINQEKMQSLGLQGMGASPGEENRLAKFLFTNLDLYGPACKSVPDGDTWLHVANDKLKTVGELGFITTGPWSSIRLYNHHFEEMFPNALEKQCHPVFDYFMVKTNHYVRGSVNLNSSNINVLASVFYGVPDREYYEGGTNLSWDKAYQIAQSLSTNSGSFSNVSAIGSAAVWSNFFLASEPEIAKESVIRNSADLLTVRQNFFTIYLVADVYRPSTSKSTTSTGTSLASARAVAEVWRDPVPFTDPSGKNHYKCLVRRFTVLDE